MDKFYKTIKLFPKISIFIFILFFCFFLPLTSQSEEDDYTDNPAIKDINQKIESKKEQIEHLKDQADKLKEEIEEQREVGVNLRNELAILDNIIAKIQLDIQLNQILIDQNNLEIESLKYLIEKEEEKIKKFKKRLSEYIRLIDKSDRKSYLEVLILNESFSEFFIQASYAEDLQGQVQKSLVQIKNIKEALETSQAELEIKKINLKKLQRDLEDSRAKLEAEIRAKENLIIQTKNSELEFQKLLGEAKAQQNEIDADIFRLHEQAEDKIKELERQKKYKEQVDLGQGVLAWPINPSRGITAYFHDPDYPYRYLFEHSGIDIRAYQSTEIISAEDGYVARARDAGYGYSYIIIIHDSTISTLYGHISNIYVKEDTFVSRGEIIGLSGGMPGTPGAGKFSTGPHLHFEVRLNGIPVNPLEYLE